MVDIDFNRMIDSAKDELDLAKTMFMPENKRQEYYQQRRDKTEKRFYDKGSRYNSNRQLYMIKMITTPLIKEGLMSYLQKTTEMGNGYQPDPNVPLVFLPQYNDHIDMYYKGYKLFDLEMKDSSGLNTSSGIKSATIANEEVRQILARISNDEWNEVVDKVVPEIISDGHSDDLTVMMSKTDTDYIQRLQYHVKIKDVASIVSPSLSESFSEKPDAYAQVNGMSDDDLQKMYESMMQGQALESDAIDHQYGG